MMCKTSEAPRERFGFTKGATKSIKAFCKSRSGLPLSEPFSEHALRESLGYPRWDERSGAPKGAGRGLSERKDPPFQGRGTQPQGWVGRVPQASGRRSPTAGERRSTSAAEERVGAGSKTQKRINFAKRWVKNLTEIWPDSFIAVSRAGLQSVHVGFRESLPGEGEERVVLEEGLFRYGIAGQRMVLLEHGSMRNRRVLGQIHIYPQTFHVIDSLLYLLPCLQREPRENICRYGMARKSLFQEGGHGALEDRLVHLISRSLLHLGIYGLETYPHLPKTRPSQKGGNLAIDKRRVKSVRIVEGSLERQLSYPAQ